MNRALAVLVALACGSAAAAEEPKAVTDARVVVETKGTASTFAFSARTSLRDGTRFDLHLYFVRRWKIPPALVEPGQPDYDEELVELDHDDCNSKDGAIQGDLGVADEAPWPGRYRVIVSWPDADAPSDDGLARVAADVETGDEKTLPRLCAQIDREIYEDLARIGRVIDGLRRRWKALGDAADPTWREFRAEADRRINAIKERNGRRRKVEMYWMETRGKQRIDWTLQKLCPLLDKAALHLGRPVADRPKAEDLDLALADTEEDYQHYLDFLGIGKIVDADAVDAALATIQKLGDEVKDWRGRAAAEPEKWLEASGDLSGRLLEASMKLSEELPEAYFRRAEAVQKCLLRQLDHVREVAAGRKPTVEWDDLAGKLDAAVKELKESIPRVRDE